MTTEILPDILAGQYVPDADTRFLTTRPAAPEAHVIDATLATVGEATAEYLRRQALVHEIAACGRTATWEDLAARHGLSLSTAHWLWNRYVSGGDAAIEPGKRVSEGFWVFEREPLRDAHGQVLLSPAAQRPVRRLASAESHAALAAEIRSRWVHLGKLNKGKRGARDAARTVTSLQDDLGPYLDRNALFIEYRSLARFVKRFLSDDPKSVAARAERRYYPSSHGLPEQLRGITDLLQVICVDSTMADLLCVGNDGLTVLERGWILYGVDVRSRALWSWLITRRQPSAHHYLRLFERGVLPKDDICARRGTVNRYPVHGIPQLILADRGMAEAAEDVRFKALGLGVIVEHAPSLLPQMKGHVERIAGTVSRGLLHRLPGTTLSNPLQLGGHDSVREALRYGITFDRFEANFDRAIIDGFMDKLHTSLGRTPIEEWERVASTRREPRQWS